MQFAICKCVVHVHVLDHVHVQSRPGQLTGKEDTKWQRTCNFNIIKINCALHINIYKYSNKISSIHVKIINQTTIHMYRYQP